MKTRVATQLRVGRIRYLNTLPFYHGFSSHTAESGLGLEWESGTPVEINQKIRQGKIDIAPISSLEYLNSQDQYLLLPDLCIGARDFSASVLLLSTERIEGLNKTTVSVTEESLSAATLLRILLKHKFRFQNQFRTEPSNPDEMLTRSKSCLVIGDQALFFRPREFVYKTDLSELWWEWTGLPFCFSLWAVRKTVFEDHPEEIKAFSRRLKINLEKNLLDIEKLLKDGFGLTLADEKFATAFGYLFNLIYQLDEAMQKGLLRFYELAHEHDLAPEPKKLEFID